MDFFDLCSPPPKKKKREDEQVTPDEKKCELALEKPGIKKGYLIERSSVPQHLKKWDLNKEFKACDGMGRLGCVACMKYGAWCKQEGADTKKKKKKKKKKNNKKKKSEHEDEASHADIQQALQKGTYQPLVGAKLSRLKYCLQRHLSGARHKAATGAREREENENVNNQDVPSDAQMMFVYDGVKKNPMVPTPCGLVDNRAFSLNLFWTPSTEF